MEVRIKKLYFKFGQSLIQFLVIQLLTFLIFIILFNSISYSTSGVLVLCYGQM